MALRYRDLHYFFVQTFMQLSRDLVIWLTVTMKTRTYATYRG